MHMPYVFQTMAKNENSAIVPLTMTTTIHIFKIVILAPISPNIRKICAKKNKIRYI